MAEPQTGDTARRWLFIGLLWAFATGFNLLKPFHIDDTAHLVIARHILADPLHPLSGLLNWTDISEPIFATNQPHLFFYLMAAVMAVAGASEIGLHLLESVFVLLALVFADRLMRARLGRRADFALAAMAVSPGFIINQNVMVDMPTLALMTGAVALLSCRQESHRSAAAGFGLYAGALLTKYSALFLLPALLAASLRRGRWIWVVLPLLALAGWSLFNLFDYGKVHILNRAVSERGLWPSERLTLSLAASLGAFCLPVAVWLVAAGGAARRFAAVLWALAAAGYLGLYAYMGTPQPFVLIAVNGLLFSAAAVVLAAATFRGLVLLTDGVANVGSFGSWFDANVVDVALLLWLAGGAAFLVTFPPFMAVRHALLLVPPLFILAMNAFETAQQPQFRVRIGAVAIWALAAAFVAGNDIAFARFYRDAAPQAAELARAAAGANGRVWHRGHWGWQWYADLQGMREFETGRTKLAPGDVLVDPTGISAQTADTLGALVPVARIEERRTLFSLLDTHGFYAHQSVDEPVVRLNPGREVVIFRVPEN